MIMINYRSIFGIVVGLMLTVGTVSAQRLAVASAGSKTVTLNDKINKNQFVWVSDAPLESIKGTAENVSGSFTIDPQNLSSINGTIATQVRSMKTGNATRDNHLVSSEWLDANKYPAISFTIASVDNIQTNGNIATAVATGNFTMHGVTKKITVPFRMTYLPESDKTRQRAPGDLVMIAADFNISLNDFNVTGTGGVIGSKVGQTIKITAQLFGNTTQKGSLSER